MERILPTPRFMKQFYITFLIVISSSVAIAQIINFPDPNFKYALLNHDPVIDSNGDGEIQISEANAAIALNIFNSDITSLEGLEHFMNITTLDCRNNNFPVLDAGFLVNMITLDFSNNPNLATINLSNLETVQNSLDLRYLNNLTSIDLGNLTEVGESIRLDENPLLTYINLQSLETLGLGFNMRSNPLITEIDLPNLVIAGGLSILSNNSLTSFSAENLVTTLMGIVVHNNHALTVFSLPMLASLGNFNMHDNNLLTSLSFPNLQTMQRWGLSWGGDIYLGREPSMTSVDFGALQTIEYNIEIERMPNVTTLNFTNLVSVGGNIDISGIDLDQLNFPNLETVKDLTYFTPNSGPLNLGSLIQARNISASGSSINLNTLETVNNLNLQGSLLTSLIMDNLLSANSIRVTNTGLNHFSVNNLTSCTQLNLSDNNLETLDISSIAGEIYSIDLNSNQLTELTLGDNLSSVTDLTLGSNNFENLDFSHVPIFGILNVSNNELVSLFIKNGTSEILRISDNPNLQFVCADEEQLEDVNTAIALSRSPRVHAHSYCSFVLGGDFFEIKGMVRSDYDMDGCDLSDAPVPFFQVQVSDGTNSGVFGGDSQGKYSFSVQEGSHLLTPLLQNPSYFNVSPSEIIRNFPTDPTPFQQDFCFTPNGEHPDLEITIVPISDPLAGFQSTYKIIYHNKGNQIQSGEIQFHFYPNTEFISSDPEVAEIDDDTLYYYFIDLMPFETRVINLIMNINGPMDTPAVHIGDFLGYGASIFPMEDDETPNDNVFGLKQEVLGSYDPNDKTCLQGESVLPETVGEYVHYLIRFENTGNYAAQNIVVKDSIDSGKFDSSTFRPLHSSHEFYTRINHDVVEFVFENINLPFDDKNNDGYVLFKIKTNNGLQLGDTFSNGAAIYFDYNFPVITNEYSTLIEDRLGTQDFDFVSKFILYPNPAKNLLKIKKIDQLLISSIEIYNMVGQLVIAIPSEVETIDISSLSSGNYLVKIHTKKGSSFSKFIKE